MDGVEVEEDVICRRVDRLHLDIELLVCVGTSLPPIIRDEASQPSQPVPEAPSCTFQLDVLCMLQVGVPS